MKNLHPLKVAFLAGTLGQGGAEKQLLYMARALGRAGHEVQVYSLTQGECYEGALRASGLDPVYVGKIGNPLARLCWITLKMRAFKPDIIQAGHFYVNLYTAFAARCLGAVGFGAIRNDTTFELKHNPRWGRWLLRAPMCLISNSHVARDTAISLGIPAPRIDVLPNVIDLEAFDENMPRGDDGDQQTLIAVGRLVAAKCFDRLLSALPLVLGQYPELRVLLVGDGPERGRLERLTHTLNLAANTVSFLGRRDDVPRLLAQSDIFCLTSQHEGFPNVVLEAMAARLPVVATPAGDVPHVVREGETGFVVPHNDRNMLAQRILELTQSRKLRQRMGSAGRACVEAHYSVDKLGEHLMALYLRAASAVRHGRLERLLSSAIPA